MFKESGVRAPVHTTFFFLHRVFREDSFLLPATCQVPAECVPAGFPGGVNENHMAVRFHKLQVVKETGVPPPQATSWPGFPDAIQWATTFLSSFFFPAESLLAFFCNVFFRCHTCFPGELPVQVNKILPDAAACFCPRVLLPQAIKPI